MINIKKDGNRLLYSQTINRCMDLDAHPLRIIEQLAYLEISIKMEYLLKETLRVPTIRSQFYRQR